MSNKCPYCGAPAGRSHEPCPYGPGGKFSKTVEKVKTISAKGLTQAQRPEGRHESAQPVKLGVDDEDEPKKPASSMLRDVGVFIKKKTSVPGERKSKVAELQTKAESVKTKAGRPQSRAGKKAATVWLTPDEMKRLQQASLDHGVPQERIMAEAIAEILAGKYKL